MFGETTIFHVQIWNHPIETANYIFMDASGEEMFEFI